MRSKMILYLLFGVLFLVSVFEAGFYFGFSFKGEQIDDKKKIQSDLSRSAVEPISGLSKQMIQAFSDKLDINTRSMASPSSSVYNSELCSPDRIAKLKKIPNWYILESGLYSHMMGRVVSADWKNGYINFSDIHDNKQVYKDQFYPQLFKDTIFVLKKLSSSEEIPIKKEDIQSGDIISIYDKIDFITNKLTYLKIVKYESNN